MLENFYCFNLYSLIFIFLNSLLYLNNNTFIIINSKNQIKIQKQSAGNQNLSFFFSKIKKKNYKILDKKVGSSETIRTLSKKEKEWLAGVIDGDGNFDMRNLKNNKKSLRSIRIVQSLRDARILYKVKDLLKAGSIKKKNKNCLVYILSKKELMFFLLNQINGNIRIKVDSFKQACESLNIIYIKAYNVIPKNSAYLAGLIDTDGSIIFNYPGNRIDIFLEFKQNIYTEQLNFDYVIPGSIVKINKYLKRNQNKDKIYYSIRFCYANIKNMLLIYNYIKENRLYSDFKFFRCMQIKRFLEIRSFKQYPKESLEYQLYKEFLIRFFTYMNEHKQLPKYLL